MLTFDEFWGSLGTSIFGKSSSAANNTRSRLPSDYLSVSYDYEELNGFNYSCKNKTYKTYLSEILLPNILFLNSSINCLDQNRISLTLNKLF